LEFFHSVFSNAKTVIARALRGFSNALGIIDLAADRNLIPVFSSFLAQQTVSRGDEKNESS
jgi:hypothetical protein